MTGMVKKLKAAIDWMDRHPGKAGAVAGWAQQAVSAGVALLLVPVLTRYLSPSDCGIWFSFQGMVAVASLANFGIGQVVARQTAYNLGAQSAGDHGDFLDFGPGEDGVRNLNHYAGVIYWMVLGLAGLIGLATFELLVPRTELLVGPVGEFRPVWYAMLGAGLMLIVASRYAAFLIGAGKTHVVKLLAIFYSTVQGLSVLAAVSLFERLLPMALVSLATGGSYAIVLCLVARHQVPGVRGSQIACVRKRGVVWKLIRVSFPLGVVNIGGFLFSNVQVPIVGSLLGPAIVTPYYLAQKLAQFVVLGCQQSLQPQLPKFTRFIASLQSSDALRLLIRAMAYYGSLVLLAAVGFLFGTPVVLRLMAGDSTPISFPVIGLMAIDLMVLAISVALSHLVIASGRNPFVVPTLMGGLANIALIFLLVPRLGLLGLPLATLISGLATTYLAGFVQGRKLVRELKDGQVATAV